MFCYNFIIDDKFRLNALTVKSFCGMKIVWINFNPHFTPIDMLLAKLKKKIYI